MYQHYYKIMKVWSFDSHVVLPVDNYRCSHCNYGIVSQWMGPFTEFSEWQWNFFHENSQVIYQMTPHDKYIMNTYRKQLNDKFEVIHSNILFFNYFQILNTFNSTIHLKTFIVIQGY